MTELESLLIDNIRGNDMLLYHYTSLDSSLKILESNRLRLSNLANLNDPLEFHNFGGFGFNGFCNNISKVLDELVASLKERENTVRLLCFCKDEFCNQSECQNEKAQHKADNLLHKGWARSRMWAQYADNHKGVCLVFNKPEFKTEFEKKRNNHIKILDDRQITYTNYLHELESEMTYELNTKNSDETFYHYYLNEKRLQYLFLKCEDYRDEIEYRFALIDDSLKSSADEVFVDFGKSLKAIILGQRFSTFIKVVPPFDVEQYRIHWNYGIPELIRQ